MSAAVHAGEVLRVRRGWYALPDASDELIRSVRVGGRMACATALRSYGVWVVSDSRLHIHVAESGSRLRSQHDRFTPLGDRGVDGVVIHRGVVAAAAHATRLRLSVADALGQYLREHNDEVGVAALDSALHHRLITSADIWRLRGRLPGRCRALLDEVDARSESGIESIVRARLRRAGIPSRTQVVVFAGMRVDLVVGDRLIIETDGREFHDDPLAFERDRRRDLLLKALGYEVLRLSYAQVMGDWESVLGAIQSMMARGQHLRLS